MTEITGMPMPRGLSPIGDVHNCGQLLADPTVWHYVKKADILRNVVEGTRAATLCGEYIDEAKMPGARSSGPSRLRCPACVRIYRSLPGGGSR
jgi:hypothetical protein